MVQPKMKKSFCFRKVICVVIAILALVWGAMNIIISNSTSSTYIEHCASEGYAEGDARVENLCEDMTVYHQNLYNQTLITQCISLFSVAIFAFLAAFRPSHCKCHDNK